MLREDRDIDIALLDLNMPGVRGFEGLLQLRTAYPHIPLIVVSGHEHPRTIDEAMSLGAAGFIPKSAKKNVLAEAFGTVMQGGTYIPRDHKSPQLGERESARRDMIERLAALTPQQMRVLKMLRDGKLNKQIAHELQVGETTVKAHVSEILRKLNVVNRTQAVIEIGRIADEGLAGDDLFGEAGGGERPS